MLYCLIPSNVRFSLFIKILIGLRRNFSVILKKLVSIVAENNPIWVSVPIELIICLIWVIKPSDNNSSASSRTKTRIVSILIIFLVIISNKRPGVPITT